MGWDVYLEDQNHKRGDIERGAGRWIADVLPLVSSSCPLSGVTEHGDTMFNVLQVRRIIEDLSGVLLSHPGRAEQVAGLTEVLERAVRLRGYVWISGD